MNETLLCSFVNIHASINTTLKHVIGDIIKILKVRSEQEEPILHNGNLTFRTVEILWLSNLKNVILRL